MSGYLWDFFTTLLYSHTQVEHRPSVFSFHRWRFLAWARIPPKQCASRWLWGVHVIFFLAGSILVRCGKFHFDFFVECVLSNHISFLADKKKLELLKWVIKNLSAKWRSLSLTWCRSKKLLDGELLNNLVEFFGESQFRFLSSTLQSRTICSISIKNRQTFLEKSKVSAQHAPQSHWVLNLLFSVCFLEASVQKCRLSELFFVAHFLQFRFQIHFLNFSE